MEVLWAKGPLKGRDLHTEVRRRKDIAYTTALTILNRLAHKGLVCKDRGCGRIIFSPRVSREVYQSAVATDLVQKAFAVSPGLAVSAFAGAVTGMSDESLDELARLIREKKDGQLFLALAALIALAPVRKSLTSMFLDHDKVCVLNTDPK
jgi:predicted transcriptional regulator